MGLYCSQLRERGILSSADLAHIANGEQVTVARQILIHQAPPTAKGHHFITLEDEFGFINVVIRLSVYTYFRNVLCLSSVLIIFGTIQTQV